MHNFDLWNRGDYNAIILALIALAVIFKVINLRRRPVTKGGYILVTQNGGVNWTILERAKYPTSSGWKETMLWGAVTCDEETAWVLGTGGSFFRINITNYNWIFISKLSLSLGDLAMVNSTHGWASGNYGEIIRTTDGWQSYEIQYERSSKSFFGIFFWDIHKGWVVGFDNTILATTDGGNHWQIQYSKTSLLESPFLSNVFFLNEFKGSEG